MSYLEYKWFIHLYVAATSIIVPAVKLFYLKQYNLLYTHYQRTIFFISDLENEKKKRGKDRQDKLYKVETWGRKESDKKEMIWRKTG